MAGDQMQQHYINGGAHHVLVEGKLEHQIMGGGGGGGGGVEVEDPVVRAAGFFFGGGRRGTALALAFRTLAMVFTLAAAFTLGLDKQTKEVTINVGAIALSAPVTAKSSYLSAFKYFVVANAIAGAFAAMSLIFSLASKGKKKVAVAGVSAAWDIIMVALLYSAIGAAGAVGMIGIEGNDHLKWQKVCNVFDKFCHVAFIGLVLSFMGSLTYLFLIFHSISLIHKRHN